MTGTVIKMLQGEKYTVKLAGYYGTKKQSYNTLLGPLMAKVSFGPGVQWDRNTYDTYNIVCALEPRNAIPSFGSVERLREKIWHEFGHSYVNPLVEDNWDRLSGYASLMNSVSYAGGNYGSDWKTCVCEHLVRAVTTRLAYREYGQQAGDAELKMHKDFGFAYIGEVCERLEEYESHRSKYKTLAEFYPRIVELFDNIYSRKK